MQQANNKRSTRTLILAMLVLVVLSTITAKVYYSRINQGVDPRILPARMGYKTYNEKAQISDFTGILNILDSIAFYYQQVPHYQNSYELGVAHINRAATFMTVGLHIDSLRVSHSLGFMKNLTKKGLLDLAEEELNKGIQIYSDWNYKYQDLDIQELTSDLRKNFYLDFDEYPAERQEQCFKARLKELETAQWENDRRLSVAFTNLGIIYFQRDNYTQAAEYFNMALELWGDNLNAENNLNSMLGRPLVKRNFIQKMFPKEREGG